ncbi:hypothetical protein AX774_g1510 [Zancudomyces culisetae]|uniref:Uncharacterized protein n=1 Tax=Zancudomyces culisetae TaxID=1213189 RepID=A0A1R1PVK7_ZANCU|nr:hypothetical protein AX774_g1510 [Zancudomyces culisetae]|eukprot:OMH84959.1 hypothetical protein AX774_g1510 [Zancudomyces culisetae]
MNGNLRIRKKEIGRGYGSGSGTGVAGGEDEGEEDEEEEEGEEGGDVQQEKIRNVDGGSGGRYTSNDTDSDMDDSNQSKGLRGDVLGQGSRRASESIDQEKRTENEIELEKVYEYLKSGVSVGGKVDQCSSANKENANEAEKNDMQITAGNWGKNINTEKYNIVAGYEYRNEDSVSESSKEERVGQKRKASKVLPGEAGIWKMRMNMYTSGKEERMRADSGRGSTYQTLQTRGITAKRDQGTRM